MKNHKQLLWTLLALVIALLTITAVLSQSRDMSFSDLGKLLASASPGWIFLSIVCMFGYIFFEALTLLLLLKASGYKKNIFQTLEYSSADIYCSAITPSATGGQPVCAWFMKRDGIPMGYITAVLALYLILHTFATLTICILSTVAGTSMFLDYSVLGKIMIVLGYIAVTFLAVLFVCLLRMEKKIYRIGVRIIGWLVKKGWVKRKQYWENKLASVLNDYSSGVKIINNDWRVLLLGYLFCVAQRLSQTIVSSLVYIATGGSASGFGSVFIAQCFSTIGSIAAPIPGGMGFADYLLYNGLHSLMDRESALQLELLSRGLSFYLMVLISLLIVIIGYLRRRHFYFNLQR